MSLIINFKYSQNKINKFICVLKSNLNKYCISSESVEIFFYRHEINILFRIVQNSKNSILSKMILSNVFLRSSILMFLLCKFLANFFI